MICIYVIATGIITRNLSVSLSMNIIKSDNGQQITPSGDYVGIDSVIYISYEPIIAANMTGQITHLFETNVYHSIPW